MNDHVVLSALSWEWKYFPNEEEAYAFVNAHSLKTGKYLLLSGDEMLNLVEKTKEQEFSKILRGE